MFGFSDLVTFAADKQRIVFRGDFFEGYQMVMSRRVAALWELVERARRGEMFTREDIVKAYADAGKMPDGWQQRLKIANGRNDEGAYHRMIQLGHDLFLVGKWDGQREIWFHDPYALHGAVYGMEHQPIEELVEGEDYHFEDEFYEFAGPGWNGEGTNPEPAKPTFDELPPRQQEFLLALQYGETVVKNGATRAALRRHGYIDNADLWGAIRLTEQGRAVVMAGINKRDAALVMMCDGQDDKQPVKTDRNPLILPPWKPGPPLKFFDDDQPTSEVFALRQERDEANTNLDILRHEYCRAFGLAWQNVLTGDMPRLMADEIILQRRNREVEQAYSDSLKTRCDEQERILARVKHGMEQILELSPGLTHQSILRIAKDVIAQVDAITQEQAHVE